MAAAATPSTSVPVSISPTSDIRAQFDAILIEIRDTHFFPKAAMKACLKDYSNAELQLIYQDFLEIREKTFAHAAPDLNFIVTAGGPSAGKSTILERLNQGENNPARCYIDPDRQGLQIMENTYLADVNSKKATSQDAYEHWRQASIFIANALLGIALDKGYPISFGSTMATPHAKNAFLAIKNQYGYPITLVHVTANEEVRVLSEARRRETLVQCTDKDFKEKNEMFFSLLATYINPNHCDKVEFHYRGTYETSVCAATLEKGKLTIHDEQAFEAIQQAHNAAQGEGFWEQTFSSQFPLAN